MKQLVLLLFILATPFTFANDTTKITYLVDSEVHNFTRLEKGKIIIVSSCVKGKTLQKCHAAQALKKVSFKSLHKIKKQKSYNQSPGELLCKYEVNGKIIWGYDRSKKEHPFCKFKDGSIVKADSLLFYTVHKNK